MTLEKTIELLKEYDELIARTGAEARDQSGYMALFGYRGWDRQKILEHGRWMCQKAQTFDGLVRMNRWLGFIQCILLVNNIAGLDKLRTDTRPGPDESRVPDPRADLEVKHKKLGEALEKAKAENEKLRAMLEEACENEDA